METKLSLPQTMSIPSLQSHQPIRSSHIALIPIIISVYLKPCTYHQKYISLIMCHKSTNIHKQNIMNCHINHVSKPHYYGASTYTNIFNNTSQPNYLKHVPYDTIYASIKYPRMCAKYKQQVHQ